MTYVTPRMSEASRPHESSLHPRDSPADGTDTLTVLTWDSFQRVCLCVHRCMCARMYVHAWGHRTPWELGGGHVCSWKAPAGSDRTF